MLFIFLHRTSVVHVNLFIASTTPRTLLAGVRITKDLHRLKVKGWKKNIPSKLTGKKAGVAILISDKIDFKTKAIKRDTKGHFIIPKGRIHQENINIVNIYAPNIGAPKYIRKSRRISRKI